MNMRVVIDQKVSGRYKVEKFRGDVCTYESPWCSNLITNGGLDRMGTHGDWLTWCQVGTSNTAPANTDSALVGRLAGTNSKTTAGAITVTPRTVTRTNVYTFAAGTATGNVAEVGVGWTTTATLFSRALILDSEGAATTVTVLADETLRVTYEFTFYIPTVDTTGNVTLNAIVYAWVGRASNAETTNGSNWQVGENGTAANQTAGTTSEIANAYSGAIGAITTIPSGTASLYTTNTFASYASESYERSVEWVWNFDQANFVAGEGTGVGAIGFKAGIGRYQIGFTPKIPKLDTQTLKLTVKHAWSRYVA